MLHPLEQELAALRRRARRMAAVYGLSVAVTTVIAIVTFAGSIDRLLRLDDRGLRIMASLATWGVLCWVAYRILGSTLFVRLRPIDLAQRVERAFPQLSDRLLSAVEFLQQAEDDPTAGSAALRRAVVAQTAAETRDLDFSEVLDPRPARRAAAMLAAMCLAAAVLVVVAPADARTAVARLINPFGNTSWPRTTQLVIRQPVERIARGESFQIEVAAAPGTRLPAEVRIQYRDQSPEGAFMEETQPMRFANGAMVARRENVQRTFSYRVEGGDDRSMRWTTVEVVEPPAIESLSIHLIPPAYTGWASATSEGPIRGLVGTEVRMTGNVAAPLASATLCLEDGRKLPAWTSGDGRWFTVGYGATAFLIERSGAYWFELTDREGLHGGADGRWEIRAIPDAVPTVRIERPAANLFVTSRAVVPIRVSASDDLAIRQIGLVFRRGDSEPEQTTMLFSGPTKAPRLLAQNPDGDSRVVDYRWDLAGLELRPAAQVTFYATADDYLPQTGKSDLRRLIVVTPDELQDRIANREKLIVTELQRALKMQAACRSQVDSLAARLVGLQRFERSDVDRLQAAEHEQRVVDQLLTSRSDGVPMHVLALLEDFENNRLENADIRRQMAALIEELDGLGREHLPPMDHAMTAAVKTAQADRDGQGSATGGGPVAASLVTAAKHQEAIIASLELWLRQLTRSDNFRRFQREVSQLARDQEEVARRTAIVGRRTLTRDLRDLSSQDAADLKRAAEDQLELARSLDRVLQEMDQAGIALGQNDPLAGETIADALSEARRLGIAGQMRTAGDQAERNQIGEATAGQKQIARDLEHVTDILANRRQQDADRLAKRLGELEADLLAIEQRQQRLRKQIDTVAADNDQETRQRGREPLAGQERQLQRDTQQLGERLERLQAEKAARAATNAAGQMGQAGDRAGEGDYAEASRRAAEAQQSLAEAHSALADAAGRAAAELASGQRAQLEENVKRLRHEQGAALEETKRIRGLAESEGQLSRAQASAIHDLARVERTLQADAAGLGKRLVGASTFGFVLAQAAAEMGRAGESLDRRDTGPATQTFQRNALRRLDLLIESLKPEPSTGSSNAAGGGNDTGHQEARSEGSQSLAELKLLKLWQQEINLGTQQFHQALAAAGTVTSERRRQCDELSGQQGHLADIVLQALRPAEQVAEPLAAIGGEMRNAQHRLEQIDSGTTTQHIQQNIVVRLERLIEQSRRKSGEYASSAGGSQPTAPQTPTAPRGSMPSSSAQKPADKAATAKSSRPSDDTRARKADAAETQVLMKRLWGMLPQRTRQRMLELPAEKFPPKYERQIEDYFRRLSAGERKLTDEGRETKDER